MHKILDEIINFIEKTMKTWRMGWTAGGESLAETKLQRGIFQGNALSPLQFVIAMILLNHILRKYTAGYKITKLQEKIKIRIAANEPFLKTISRGKHPVLKSLPLRHTHGRTG